MVRIRAHNYRVVQRARGGIAPWMQLMIGARYGRAVLEAIHQQNIDRDDACRAVVDAERAAAVARGVHVVVDETRPDNYTQEELPGE